MDDLELEEYDIIAFYPDQSPGLETLSSVLFGTKWEHWFPNNLIIIYAGMPKERRN